MKEPESGHPSPSFLIGVSGHPAGVLSWQGRGQTRHLAGSREGFSVYGVAISPNGLHAAAATKSPGEQVGRGYLEVHATGGDDAGPSAARQPCVYALPYPAYAVDWISDDTLAVGTVEQQGGRLRGLCALFEYQQRTGLQPARKPPVASLHHPGAVTVVHALGDGRLLTVCTVGRARVWQLQSGTLEAEFADESGAANLPFLPTASVLPDGRSVLLQFPSGHLRLLHCGAAGWEHSALPTAPNASGGWCCLGEALLVSDWGSPSLRMLRMGSWESLGTLSLGRPAQRLLALGPGLIAAHHLDGGVSVWRIEPALERLEDLPIRSVRSIGGGMPSAQLARATESARLRAEQERFAALQEAIRSASSLAEVRDRIGEVLASGQGFEGLVLLADWCRQRKNPLAELQVRSELCRNLPELPESAIHLRILGELLAALGEPLLALDALRRAHACDPSAPGIDALIAEVQRRPTPVEGAIYLVPAQDGAAAACDRVRECLLRDLAAGRPQPRQYAIELRNSVPLLQRPDQSLDIGSLSAQLCAGLSQVQMQDVTFASEGRAGAHGVQLLSHVPRLHREPDTGLRLLCELARAGAALEYNLYLTVVPTGTDPSAMAEAALEIWIGLRGMVGQEASAIERRRASFEDEVKRLVPRLVGAAGTHRKSSSASGRQSAAAKTKASGGKSKVQSRKREGRDGEFL